MSLKLRPYQEQAITAEAEYRREHPDENRLAITMATGLGKTIVMAARAADFLADEMHRVVSAGTGELPRRVLILVHTDELTQQAEDKIKKFAPKWAHLVGVVKAGRDETDKFIIIGSVQTLASLHRRGRIKDVGLVIVDECHHAIAPAYERVLRHFGCYQHEGFVVGGVQEFQTMAQYLGRLDTSAPPTPCLGLTATLERGDGQSLGGVWQNVVFSRDISWAVRKGYLVQPIGHRLEVPDLDGKFTTGSAEISDAALAGSIAPARVVDEWINIGVRPSMCDECIEAMDQLKCNDGQQSIPSYCPNGCPGNRRHFPTVLFAPLVRSATLFAEAFERAGVTAGVIHGNLPKSERRLLLKRFAAGQIEVLCNAMVLTEGFDCDRQGWPECVIVARPTKSRPLFIQMAGRGLRPDPLIPVEDQACHLLVVADSTTDMCTIADLSDKPLDRKLSGTLTALEDEYDIGQGIEDAERHWTGRVEVSQFDPIVNRSSKVWRKTKAGVPFLPIGKRGQYVFVVDNGVFLRERGGEKWRTVRLHRNLPDMEFALTIAEDEATERGGDVGALLADRTRAWRKARPSDEMLARAAQLGLKPEVDRIMASRQGEKAGRISDLMSRVQATAVIDPLVQRIRRMDG